MRKKTLILMRHAKSDWYAGSDSDLNRPLNARGRAASDRVGGYFSKTDMVVDEILHSSAKRTTETAERVIQTAGWQKHNEEGQPLLSIRSSDAIYLCTTAQLIREMSRVNPNIDTLLVINHQPTCAELIYQWFGQWVRMKTASFAIIECAMEGWASLSSCDKTLMRHLCPAEIEKMGIDLHDATLTHAT